MLTIHQHTDLMKCHPPASAVVPGGDDHPDYNLSNKSVCHVIINKDATFVPGWVCSLKHSTQLIC